MTSLFLMVYMTEIAGISAAIAGAIYGITKIWAGVSDLIAGQLADRTNTKWGRLRPYLLFGSLPLAAVFVLMFSVPAGLSMQLTIAWVFLFDAAFQLAYSFVNIPYGSLSAAITQNPVGRSRLSGARAIANAIASVALSAIIAPQFADTAADGIRLRFTIICIVLAVIGVGLLWICFARTKEVVPRSKEKVSLKQALLGLTKNRPLIVLCVAAFFRLGALFTLSAVAMYYVTFVLGNASLFVFLQLSQTVGMILISALVPTITRRFGKRNGYITLAVIAAVGFALIFFVPMDNLFFAMVAWFIVGVGVGGTNALMFAMQADTVDYGEWVTGVRSEAGSHSILSFVRKVGQGVGGWVGGAVIAAFGYVSMSDTQTPQAITGIRVSAGLIPAAMAFICGFVVIFYHLNAEKHETIVEDLNERHAQNFVASTKGVETEAVKVVGLGDGRSTLLRRADEPLPPIITLFGERGSGATDIAPMLAKQLDVQYIGQVFDYRELAEIDPRDIISDNALSRWMRSQSSFPGMASSPTGSSSANQDIAASNTEFVLSSVEEGGVVLGRNSALVLGKVVGVLHVRLMAPMGKSVERVMEQTGLSASKALEQCEAEDRIRAEMAMNLYDYDPRLDRYYDVVINTGTVTYKQVVEFIEEIYYSKYPNAIRPAQAGAKQQD